MRLSLSGVAVAMPLADDRGVGGGGVGGDDEELMAIDVVAGFLAGHGAGGKEQLDVVARPPPGVGGGGFDVAIIDLEGEIKSLVGPAEENVGGARLTRSRPTVWSRRIPSSGGGLGPLGQIAVENRRMGEKRHVLDRLDGVAFAPDIRLRNRWRCRA